MDAPAITEEQLLRAEKNRLAALAKRKAIDESSTTTNPKDPWRLFKCRKFTCQENTLKIAPSTKRPENVRANAVSDTHLEEKFRVRLEICSHDSFSVMPMPVKGFAYPGEDECFKRLGLCFENVISTHYTQNLTGGKACVYKLWDYDTVVRCLKSANNIEYEEIPWGTLNVIGRLSDSLVTGRWTPCRPEHLPDETVNELIKKLPDKILNALLPFQLDGVKFGLQRGGRCLIADEMGLGKTLQAIAIASCFMNEGFILIVCPAILRYSWAEELERWFPCLPKDIHLVFDHHSSPAHLKQWPKIVVMSYKMLFRLRKTMLGREWAFLIVDESHHVRCSKKVMEPPEVTAVIDIATKVKRIVLLSGTPSLSRPYDIFHQINILWPGLLGKDKYDFAKTYCDIISCQSSQGQVFKNYSRGIRLEELNILLRSTVMIRRLKEHVMADLPPKRRQIIRLLLKKSDILSAKADAKVKKADILSAEGDAAAAPVGASGNSIAAGFSLENSEGSNDNAGAVSHSSHDRKHMLSYLELGLAKLPRLHDWLSLHPLFAAPNDGSVDSNTDIGPNSHKMIIFAHHHRVLDGIQEFICEKGIGFVRIDGNTLPKDRQSAVLSFQSSLEVKIAIIGITAGGVGLNLSSAKTVVFLELPPSPSWMLQAEDRAHRKGQTNAVNIYYFCAKDTMDDVHWQHLNKSLYRISSTTNGKRDAIKEIAVDDVSYLENSYDADRNYIQLLGDIACSVQPPELMQDSDPITDNIHFSIAHESANPNGEKDEADYTLLRKTSQQEASNPPPTEISKHELGATITDDENSLNMGGLLRFEVSQYTGRIHLYCCTEAMDIRPRPLFQSFRPEEFTSAGAFSNEKNTTLKILKNYQAYRQVREFINQWNKLRPIERRRLQGKPLQLPLAVELCYLNEGTNHDNRGLLNGKSRRRTTPLIEISRPLPADAEWKKVRLIGNTSKKEKEYTQGWTSTGEPLCKLCQLPCRNENSRTPEFFEDLFCNLSCYEEYRIRTSRIFLREELFQVEHGVCTNCQLDCHQLVKCIKRLPLEKRREYIMRKAPKLAKRKKLLEKLVNNPSEGNAWHADHIVPVFQGGGECRLENMRTLCVACHYEVTAAQRAERRTERLEAKKRLKGILKTLKNDSKIGVTGSKTKDDLHIEIPENAEDELLITVPGSSYTGRDESVS